MRVPVGLAITLGMVACESEVSTVVLPNLDGAQSILLAAVAGAWATSLARNADELDAIELEVPSEDEEALRLHLFAFECRLDRLGLVPGRDLPRSEMPKVVPLPRQHLVLDSRLDSVSSTWSPVDTLPAEVRGILPVDLVPARPCVSFDRRIERVTPSATGLHSGLTLPEGDVLLTGDLCFRVDLDSITEVASSTVCRMGAKFVDEGGDVWFSSNTGAMARGHPDRGFELLPNQYQIALPPGFTSAQGIGLSGSVASGQPELFAIVHVGGGPTTTEGRISIAWFHEGAWETILEPSLVRFGGPPVVQWLGPGRAVFGSAAHPGILYFQEDRIFEQILSPEAPLDRPNVFLRHPRFGIVVGTRSGALIAGEPGDWIELRPSTVALGALPVTSVLPLGEGLVFADTRSDIHQWFESNDTCRPRRALLDGVNGTVSLITLDDGILVRPNFSVPSDDQDRNGEVHRLTRRPKDPCVVDDGGQGTGWD